jgi:hypothetical protein
MRTDFNKFLKIKDGLDDGRWGEAEGICVMKCVENRDTKIHLIFVVMAGKRARWKQTMCHEALICNIFLDIHPKPS